MIDFGFILLAICVSIDSLGIGMTYGFKNTKITFGAKWILFFLSFFTTSFALWMGKALSWFLPSSITNFVGTALLILLGIWMIVQPPNGDFDHSNDIDSKEALFLGVALSLDSIGIGIGCSMVGFHSFMFPLFVAFFQLFFLSFGSYLGGKIQKVSHVPENIWNLFSGILLIGIAITKFIF